MRPRVKERFADALLPQLGERDGGALDCDRQEGRGRRRARQARAPFAGDWLQQLEERGVEFTAAMTELVREPDLGRGLCRLQSLGAAGGEERFVERGPRESRWSPGRGGARRAEPMAHVRRLASPAPR